MRKGVIVTLVTALVLAGLAVGGWFAYQWAYKQFTPQACIVEMGGGQEPVKLTEEQARNASIIVAASAKRGLPERAAVVALATAYQESDLRNLDYGDRDSLGLFQQRPSYGWGTKEQIMDPWYASNRFYKELVKFTNWQGTDVNDMAQKVQRSGHPQAYRKHVTKSEAVAGALRGSKKASLSCLSFTEAPTAKASAFEKVLGALGVTPSIAGEAMTITVKDETLAWAVAHNVVANSYDGGATSVVVGSRQWRHDVKGWAEAESPAPAKTVKVTLG